MKFILLILFTLSAVDNYGQKDCTRIQYTLDSLKQSMLKELPKYGQVKGTVQTVRWVSFSYFSSPFFIINSKRGYYVYQFHLASDSLNVKEFLTEYFKPEIIKTIAVMDSTHAMAIYGPKGIDGAVTIVLKNNAKFNPKVAGLTKVERRKGRLYGDNNAY